MSDWTDRGQCSHIVPSLNYSGPKMLDYTYSFRYAEGPRTDFDYLIQRRRDGSMILGGGRALTRRAWIHQHPSLHGRFTELRDSCVCS